MKYSSKKNLRIIFLITVLNLVTSDPFYKIEDDTSLKSIESTVNGLTMYTIDLLIGTKHQDKPQTTTSIVDIQSDGFIVGEKTVSGWGISCNSSEPTDDNSCVMDPDQKETDCTFHNNPFKIIDGASYVRLDDTEIIHTGIFIYLTIRNRKTQKTQIRNYQRCRKGLEIRRNGSDWIFSQKFLC